MAKFVKMRFEMKHLRFFVYIHLSLIFSVFVNLVRYLEWHPCPFWWGKWLLLVTCRSSMTNQFGLWKFMLDKKGYPFQGSLFSNIFGLVFISTTELFIRKLLLSLVPLYLQLLTVFLVIDCSVLVAGWDSDSWLDPPLLAPLAPRCFQQRKSIMFPFDLTHQFTIKPLTSLRCMP